MSQAKWAACGCIIAATLALGGSYVQNALIYPALAIALCGTFWVEALLRSWRWPASPLLVIFTGATVYGARQDFPPFFMLIAISAALSAWDLDHMLQRLAQVRPGAVAPGIPRRHLMRLAAVNGLGLLVGGAALLFRLRLSFTLALLLSLVLFYALSQVVLFIRRTRD
jgi:hypothetical protein